MRRGGAELVHRLAELGEFRGRFSLRLLDLVEAVAGLAELRGAVFRCLLEAGPQRRDFGIDPRNRVFERAAARYLGAVACDPSETSRRQCATQGTCDGRYGDHRHQRGNPALSEDSGFAPGSLRFRAVGVAIPGLIPGHDQDLARGSWCIGLDVDPGRIGLWCVDFGVSLGRLVRRVGLALLRRELGGFDVHRIFHRAERRLASRYFH